ncbi:MAG: hypothetical protein ABIF09_01585 [Gemmatimonadota bacterium]
MAGLSPRIPLLRMVSLLAGCLLAAGCAAAYGRQQVPDGIYRSAIRGKPPYLHAMIRDLLEEGERNRVLNWNRIALRALRRGDRENAKSYFDLSIREINTIFANTERANQARSLWFKEEVKSFKGDPYERAMVFFYRGLLYYVDGELDNARAAFRSGQLQDAFAEESQNRSDFAVFEYLEGRVTQRIDSPAEALEILERLKRLNRGIPVPRPEENVLLVATLNQGPIKYAFARDPHQLRYRTAPALLKGVLLLMDGEVLGGTVRAEDLNFQATTRGGREFDHIMEGKVVFKRTTGELGTAALATGAVLGRAAGGSRSRKAREKLAVASLAALTTGVFLKALSGFARTEADTRTWMALPGQIYLWSGRLPPGEHRMEMRYYTVEPGNGREVFRGGAGPPERARPWLGRIAAFERKDLRREFSVRIEPGRNDTLIFVPSPNALDG